VVAHLEFDGYPEGGYVLDANTGKPVKKKTCFYGGCPFYAGPCEIVAVHNRGHIGPDYWHEDDCEVLVARADDGAMLHSYDSAHLFLHL
jgi:hypothetical protein